MQCLWLLPFFNLLGASSASSSSSSSWWWPFDGQPFRNASGSALIPPASALTQENIERLTVSVPLVRQHMPVQTLGGRPFYKSAYFGTLTVGTPPVTFKVVFDTGSGHLILPSGYCKSEACRVHKRYRRSQSTSAKDIDYDGTEVKPNEARDQITVTFGTGEVTGVFTEDVVCVVDGAAGAGASPTTGSSPDSSSDCVRLRLIAATEMSEEPFKAFHFDGVVGLGLDSLSQAPEFNFVGVMAKALKEWGAAMPHAFSVFLADSPQEQSALTLGGWKREHLVGEIGWNPVVNPQLGHWIIGVKRIVVNNQSIDFCQGGDCKAVVDTGTSLLAVPTQAFSELYQQLKHPARLGHCLSDSGEGEPELQIELDGFTIALGPKDYARMEADSPDGSNTSDNRHEDKEATDEKPENGDEPAQQLCKPTLMSMDLPAPLGPKLFLLGEPVLRKYYSIYDGGSMRVGFGLARHKPGARSGYFSDAAAAAAATPAQETV